MRRLLFMLVSLTFLFVRPGYGDIVLMLENPAANQKVSGIGPLSGWAFSTVPGAHITVRLHIDGQEVANVPCCTDRSDVANKYGSLALNSGFGQIFNFNLLSADAHDIEIKVQDGSSVKTEKHKVTVVKPGGFEFLSRLDLVFAQAAIKGQEVVIEKAHAVDKASGKDQQVTLHLAWQENAQALGIVNSENTSTSASLSQSAEAPDRAAAESEGDTATGLTLMLENPPDAKTASGIGIISGWTFSPTPGATFPPIVQFRVDDRLVGAIPCCQERLDVANAFPTQREQALRSGFGALFNFNLLTSDSHRIEVAAQDGTGATQNVTHQVTVVKLGDFEFLDQFDLSKAETRIEGGQTLVLDKVNIRDKASQQTREITASYAWQESCQCFVAQGICGNGSVEPTEECDGGSLDNQTCQSLGFSGGTLSCNETCELETKECSGGPRLYVTNVLSNSVSVVNTATNLVTTTIPAGKEPRGVAVSPTTPSAYVTNFKDDTVSVIDTTTDTVTDTILLRQGTTKKGPLGVAFAPDGTKVYVVNGFDNSVAVLSTVTKSVLTTISVGKEPQAIALTPDGTRAYVTNFADNSVSVLDTTTNALVTTIQVGNGPDGIAVSPDGNSTRAYVANFSADSVSVIDTATNTVVGTPVLVNFQPVKVAFAPDGTRAYVTSFLADSVSVIDPATNTVLSEFPTADHPDGIVVTPNGKRVYVALFGDNGQGRSAQVVSTLTTATVAPFITVEEGPFAMAIVP